MPRNTLIVVSLLAVFAALIVGVNIGKNFASPQPTPFLSATPTFAATPTPPIQRISYRNEFCGITLQYPSSMNKLENASDSAIFTDPNIPSDTVILTCQKDIPRPPLAESSIETVQISSVSAKLYHDTSGKDGTPIDKLIFKNPDTKLDVYLAGSGPTFDTILSTVSILPRTNKVSPRPTPTPPPPQPSE